MKIKILLFIMIIPVLFYAENYSLDELLDQAMEKNTSLKQAKISLEISQAKLSSAKISYLPDISAGLGRTESFDNISFEDNKTNNFASFSISKNISLNDDSYFSNKNARHDFDASQISYQIQKQNIIFDIIQNYINVLEAQKRLRLLNENIKIQESIVFESNQLFRQNKITQFEVQQSEINLLNARISALNAQNNLNLSRKKLFDLVNISDEGKELAEADLYIDESSDDFQREIDFDQILQVRQQNETVNKHRTNIKQTNLDFFPQLSLQYNYRRSVNSDDFSYSNGNTDHTIGLNISYSLNKLFRNHYSYKQVKLLDEHNNLNTNQLIKDISLKYNQYLQELNYLKQLNILLENKLAQTTSNLEMAQQRYRLGLVTQLDLDKASYENLDSKINYEVNQYQLMLKKLSIDNLLSNNLYNK